MIFRVDDNVSDVEILEYDKVSNKEYFSVIEIRDLIERLDTYADRMISSDGIIKNNIILMDDQIIGVGKNCVVIKQDEHKRIVTLQGTAYKISFPNSLYIVSFKDDLVTSIHAYCYKDYSGKTTRLYQYAMPNMLTSNRICMGSAPKKIESKDYVKTLEKIIFTQYTHMNVDNIKSFKRTDEYFRYLSKHEFPYDLLIDANTTLGKVIK